MNIKNKKIKKVKKLLGDGNYLAELIIILISIFSCVVFFLIKKTRKIFFSRKIAIAKYAIVNGN